MIDYANTCACGHDRGEHDSLYGDCNATECPCQIWYVAREGLLT